MTSRSSAILRDDVGGNHGGDGKARNVATRLYRHVLQEQEIDEALRRQITTEVLFELVVFTIDHAKSMRALANQGKSRERARAQADEKQQLLFAWLDKNLPRYPGRLDLCAADAVKAIRGLGRAPSWARRQITLYRAQRQK